MKQNLLLKFSKQCLTCPMFDLDYIHNTIYNTLYNNPTFTTGIIGCKHRKVCRYFNDDKMLSNALATEDLSLFL